MKRERIIAGLEGCANAEIQTTAHIALNRHVRAHGIELTAAALLLAGFDPPEDPGWFSAPLACMMLGLEP